MLPIDEFCSVRCALIGMLKSPFDEAVVSLAQGLPGGNRTRMRHISSSKMCLGREPEVVLTSPHERLPIRAAARPVLPLRFGR